MADIEKDGRTQPSAFGPNPGVRIREAGGYAATEPAKPIPKVDLCRAPGAREVVRSKVSHPQEAVKGAPASLEPSPRPAKAAHNTEGPG